MPTSLPHTDPSHTWVPALHPAERSLWKHQGPPWERLTSPVEASTAHVLREDRGLQAATPLTAAWVAREAAARQPPVPLCWRAVPLVGPGGAGRHPDSSTWLYAMLACQAVACATRLARRAGSVVMGLLSVGSASRSNRCCPW